MVGVLAAATRPGFYHERLPTIREAKRRVIEPLNLFCGLAWQLEHLPRRPARTVALRPQAALHC